MREGVIRIPEVISKIRQAQRVMDTLGYKSVDLLGLITADESVYKKSGVLREVIGSSIQFGLYDRYITRFRTPDIIIAPKSSKFFLATLTRGFEFAEFIQSKVLPEVLNVAPTESTVAVDFIGLKLKPTSLEDAELQISASDLLTMLAEKLEVQRIIKISPEIQALSLNQSELSYERLQICDSVEIDPLLTWLSPAWLNIQSA